MKHLAFTSVDTLTASETDLKIGVQQFLFTSSAGFNAGVTVVTAFFRTLDTWIISINDNPFYT